MEIPDERQCEIENFQMDLKDIDPKNMDAYLEKVGCLNEVREVLYKKYRHSLGIGI